ncbi:MAG: hypothetical protein ACYCVB_06625 [Bacilli bacterium]
MPMIETEDLRALGCKESFVPLMNENLGVIPIYEKVTELMFSMLNNDYSAQDVFGDLIEIIRYIEDEALARVTLHVERPQVSRPAPVYGRRPSGDSRANDAD